MSEAAVVEGMGLKKAFNQRTVFADVSFVVRHGETLLITGRNGSGKSTLVKIICGVLTPTSGKVSVHCEGPGGDHVIRRLIGLVSPYLPMFEEFSASENLSLALRIRGLSPDHERARSLLIRVGLDADNADDVRTYSSGMKQRLKYAFALLHEPPILVLDEPTANLDYEGVGLVHNIMQEQRSKGLLIVATNDPGEVNTFERQVNLDAPR
jgi:heme exporter protein A